MKGDGSGWIDCSCGSRHWGPFGAGGLLVFTHDEDSVWVLMQHRALWSHHGGTWGIPGGARDSHESVEEAALREAHEETGITSGDVVLIDAVEVHHGEWMYATVIARAETRLELRASEESIDLQWIALDEVDQRPLHPGFSLSWPGLKEVIEHAVASR